jgi:hypothetical protein
MLIRESALQMPRFTQTMESCLVNAESYDSAKVPTSNWGEEDCEEAEEQIWTVTHGSLSEYGSKNYERATKYLRLAMCFCRIA